jgi:hypothetical protein
LPDAVINWRLIETHWSDLTRVVLSIRAGGISSVPLLRRLGDHVQRVDDQRRHHTTLDLTAVVKGLVAYGWEIDREDLAIISPYITGKIRRFGEAISTAAQ